MDCIPCLEDHCRISVAVVPVGGIPVAKFLAWSNMFASYARIALRDLTPDPTLRRSFPQHDQGKGRLHFNFVNDMSAFGTQVATGTSTAYDNFQGHKRFIGAIGIIHCPTSPDLTSAYSDFTRTLSRMYPSVHIFRCFAIEPKDDQADVERGNLVMIPNQELDRIRFYVHTLLCDFSDCILRDLNGCVARQQTRKDALITTPMDGPHPADDRAMRRKQNGRWAKRNGDHCLLAGSPLDAKEWYAKAIDMCRSAGDWLWHAGAQEGHCAAQRAVTSLKDSLSGDGAGGAADEALVTRFTEALASYERSGATHLCVEAHLRLAQYHTLCSRRCQASKVLMKAFHLMQSLPPLKSIPLLNSIAAIYKKMNWMRKFALFMRHIAHLYDKVHLKATMEHTLITIAECYQVHGLRDPSGPLQEGPHLPLDGMGRDPALRTGWWRLQQCLLDDLCKVATKQGNAVALGHYASHALRTIGPQMSPQHQGKLAASLVQHVASRLPPCVHIRMTGCPRIVRLAVNRAPHLVRTPQTFVELRQRLQREAEQRLAAAAAGQGATRDVKGKGDASGDAKSASGDIFLYKPKSWNKRKRAAEPVVWPLREVFSVQLWLHNPTDVALTLDNVAVLCQSVAGYAFDAHQAKAKLLPGTVQCITLSGRIVAPPAGTAPEPSSGNAEASAAHAIRAFGVRIRALGLTWDHLVDANGYPVTGDHQAIAPLAAAAAAGDDSAVVTKPAATAALRTVLPSPEKPLDPGSAALVASAVACSNGCRATAVEGIPLLSLDCNVLTKGSASLALTQGVRWRCVLRMRNRSSHRIHVLRVHVSEQRSLSPSLYEQPSRVFTLGCAYRATAATALHAPQHAAWLSSGQQPCAHDALVGVASADAPDADEHVSLAHVEPANADEPGTCDVIALQVDDTACTDEDVIRHLDGGEEVHVPIGICGLEGALSATVTVTYGQWGCPWWRKHTFHVPIMVRNTATGPYKLYPQVRSSPDSTDWLHNGVGPLVCQRGSTIRFVVPMRRFSIAEQDLVDIPQKETQFVVGRQRTPEQIRERMLIHSYMRHMLQCVRVAWKSPRRDEGELCLARSELTLPMLRRMQAAPFEASLSASKGHPCDARQAVRVTVARSTAFTLRLCNRSPRTMYNLSVSIVPHMANVHTNGTLDSDSIRGSSVNNACVLWSGCLGSYVAQLEPGESLQRCVELTFIRPGTYHVRAQVDVTQAYTGACVDAEVSPGALDNDAFVQQAWAHTPQPCLRVHASYQE